MDFETLVRTRRSVRGYKTDPVPKKIIQEIIDIAKGAPSSMNTQPWNLYVVTGEPLDKIRQGNTERMLAGIKPQRDFPKRSLRRHSSGTTGRDR
jgi:nitroreductase